MNTPLSATLSRILGANAAPSRDEVIGNKDVEEVESDLSWFSDEGSDDERESPLHLAIYSRDVSKVSGLLLEQGIDAAEVGHSSTYTPLVAAALYGTPEILSLILAEPGVEIDELAPTTAGEISSTTALYRVVDSARPENDAENQRLLDAARQLLAAGADPEAICRFEYDPISNAGHLNIDTPEWRAEDRNVSDRMPGRRAMVQVLREHRAFHRAFWSPAAPTIGRQWAPHVRDAEQAVLCCYARIFLAGKAEAGGSPGLTEMLPPMPLLVWHHILSMVSRADLGVSPAALEAAACEAELAAVDRERALEARVSAAAEWERIERIRSVAKAPWALAVERSLESPARLSNSEKPRSDGLRCRLGSSGLATGSSQTHTVPVASKPQDTRDGAHPVKGDASGSGTVRPPTPKSLDVHDEPATPASVVSAPMVTGTRSKRQLLM